MRKSSWVRSEMICLCLSRTVAYKLTSETPTRMGCWGSCVPAGALACGPSGQASPEENGGRSRLAASTVTRSEEHTSELQSPCNLVCRLLLEKKKKKKMEVICADTVEC